MQVQDHQYQAVPSSNNMGTTSNGYEQQTVISPVSEQITAMTPFAHLLQLPVFQIYSLKEFEIIRDQIEQNRRAAQERQEIRNDLPPPPPPPTTAEAITTKLVVEYLSLISDGGTTFVMSQFNLNKMLHSTINMLDAMERISEKQSMTPSATVVYSRWASPKNRSGPTIIVDVLAWYRISKRSQMSGVQVKANTESKIKLNAEKAFGVKDGKEWKKTWFRGREDALEIVVGNGGGTSIKLEKVVAIERDLIPAVYGDFLSRWKEFRVPRYNA